MGEHIIGTDLTCDVAYDANFPPPPTYCTLCPEHPACVTLPPTGAGQVIGVSGAILALVGIIAIIIGRPRRPTR